MASVTCFPFVWFSELVTLPLPCQPPGLAGGNTRWQHLSRTRTNDCLKTQGRLTTTLGRQSPGRLMTITAISWAPSVPGASCVFTDTPQPGRKLRPRDLQPFAKDSQLTSGGAGATPKLCDLSAFHAPHAASSSLHRTFIVPHFGLPGARPQEKGAGRRAYREGKRGRPWQQAGAWSALDLRGFRAMIGSGWTGLQLRSRPRQVGAWGCELSWN